MNTLIRFRYEISTVLGCYRVAYAPNIETIDKIIKKFNDNTYHIVFQIIMYDDIQYDDIPNYGLIYTENGLDCKTKAQIEGKTY